MPRAKTVNQTKKTTKRSPRTALSSISVKKNALEEASLLQKLQNEFNVNQSYLSLILGLVIVFVVGLLVFNYLKKDSSTLGPAQETAETQKDVDPKNLPGKYTVKDGDTLFTIAQNYYNDGYKFAAIAETNKLANADVIEPGQVLEIPKIEIAGESLGTGGATNSTIWGDKIEGDTYTVVEGDWLSTIAGRAYGDPMAFDKIAKENNISNPDLIEPGTVLKLPR